MIRTMMTWQAARRRWRKWYKGVLYQISCDQLDCPQTKADSYQAANAWWSAKKAEIDSEPSSGSGHTRSRPWNNEGTGCVLTARQTGRLATPLSSRSSLTGTWMTS